MTNKLSPRLLAAVLALGAVCAPAASAQVSIGAVNTPIAENFDTLANSGTSSSCPPAGLSPRPARTPTPFTRPGRAAARLATPTASAPLPPPSEPLAACRAAASSRPSAAASRTTRVSRSRASPSPTPASNGGWGRWLACDRLDFQYSLDATSLTTGTWTDVNSLDFTTPDHGPTTGALDGNAAANRTAISDTIRQSCHRATAAIFWIRWTDFNATGADDGLAVDDFSITANPTGRRRTHSRSTTWRLAEGNAGTTLFTFTVSLSAPAAVGGVTFDIATADGTATIGQQRLRRQQRRPARPSPRATAPSPSTSP